MHVVFCHNKYLFSFSFFLLFFVLFSLTFRVFGSCFRTLAVIIVSDLFCFVCFGDTSRILAGLLVKRRRQVAEDEKTEFTNASGFSHRS